MSTRESAHEYCRQIMPHTTVGLSDGAAVQDDKLLLATRSASRHPAIPVSDAAGVHYLHT
ncbi:hypothetical protein A3216_01895 [Mycobacterium leprae 7935681]|nr:hypothetical protein [Mycobacterium leprae]OAX71977.1 hypothetical protein A3216_01895 [Mycobacterium leprae 7935681]